MTDSTKISTDEAILSYCFKHLGSENVRKEQFGTVSTEVAADHFSEFLISFGVKPSAKPEAAQNAAGLKQFIFHPKNS